MAALIGAAVVSAAATLNREDVEAKEWKYTGYRGFSSFVSSDDDFFILRKFGSLNARVILALQDEICRLERDLTALDDECSQKTGPDYHNGSFRDDLGSPRSELLIRKIYGKLKDYNGFVLQCAELRARPPVPQRNINSIKNWFYNHQNAIREEEAQYVDHASDLFSLVPKLKSPLRRLLERSVHFRIFRYWRIEKTDLEAHDAKNEIYSSDQRIDACVSVIITVVGLAMLIAPLWILKFTPDAVKSLAIITTFIVLFLVLVSYVTVSRAFETLGATAAYSAVLMVFLQLAK